MTLNDALSRVMPHVPGCSYPMAERAIHDAAEDFCETTRVLTETVLLDLVPGQATYSVAPADPDSRVFDIAMCVLDEREKVFAMAGDAGRMDDGRVVGYGLAGNTLQVFATPAKPGLLRVRTVLTCAVGTEDLPAGLQHWREAVAYGALYRLLSAPGQDWTNPAAAQSFWSMYQSQVNDAIAHATLGGGLKRPLRVRPVK